MPPEVILEAAFKVLGLEPGSKPSEVKKAYRTLAKRWHPDRHHSKPYETRALAEERFREIDEAYRRISQNWEKNPPPEQPSGAKQPAQAQDAHTPPVHHGKLHKPNIGTTLRKTIFSVFLIITAVYAMIQLHSILSAPWLDSHAPDSNAPGDAPPPPTESESLLQPSEQPLIQSHSEPPVLSQPPILQSEPKLPSTFFSIGSSTAEVLRVQGPPTEKHGQKWIYGMSEIQFRHGKVWGFNNIDGLLKIRMQPGDAEKRESLPYFTIGSSEDDVLSIQGTPSRVEGDKWYYGFSELRFKDGQLREYDNFFGNLNIRLIPSASFANSAPGFFTIGSSSDEVLALHGTPTSIRSNRWSYGFAAISFKEGKVHTVSNSDGSLRFAYPEDLLERPAQ